MAPSLARRAADKGTRMELDPQQSAARTWFEALRNRICAAFEAIEAQAVSDAAFAYTPWERTDSSGDPGGGGVRGVMKGKVFATVGDRTRTRLNSSHSCADRMPLSALQKKIENTNT